MVDKGVIFALILVLNVSCSSNNKNGFKLIIECRLPEKNVIEFNENDFLYVDWEKQEYCLEKEIIDTTQFNDLICYGSCKIMSFIDNKMEYEAILNCNMSGNNLKRKGNDAIAIKRASWNLLQNNCLQLNLNTKTQIFTDKKLEERLTKFMFDEEVRIFLEKKDLLK